MLQITLAAAFLATLSTIILGVPLALWIYSLNHAARLVRLFVILPLAMPPVVGGLALSAALGRRGFSAAILEALNLNFAFAFPGVVVAHIFVALPFVIVSVDAALRQLNPEIQASAAGIGMRPGTILRRIILPAISPAIAMGAGLAAARSLGEFGTTITFAGSLPGVTRTMPVGIYLEREIDQDRAYVLAAILIIIAILFIIAAFFPTFWQQRHAYKPQAIEIAELDSAKLAALCKPKYSLSGAPVIVSTAAGVTRFPAQTITALVGPNGSGKTTLAGLIAGRLQGAQIKIGEKVVADLKSKIFIPAYKRGVVLLTQQPGLPRTTTVSKAIDMATRDPLRTTELLTAAGLKKLAKTPIPALSGGQAAQVALLRALAVRPQVLILDEPLAAVDIASKANWRRLLKATAADRTTILITHDSLDIAGLAQHIVVLEAGKTVGSCSTAEFFQNPCTTFAAQLAGLNRITGTVLEVTSDSIKVDLGKSLIATVNKQKRAFAVGQKVALSFSPTAISICNKDISTENTLENLWEGEILSIDTLTPAAGNNATTPNLQTLLNIKLLSGVEITVPSTAYLVVEMGLEIGQRLLCQVSPDNLAITPA
ncbi:ATP-binding cassette domain-containing protein [Corynebacterium caspium]|uniref:ATP-binding cassette domain-containing protein n=1 Tax=Corynebacterium caspium TaxID=234828 RepID=UPI001FE12F42|nr:ATP-binding cassette domain-containing protein [Corynebacterium caspium]